MKKYYLLAAAAAVACMFSCSKAESPAEEAEKTAETTENTIDPNLVQGEMIIQVSEELADAIEASAEGSVPETKAPGISAAFKEIGVTSMCRMYEDAGEWEPRHREAGLHRWYRINYNPSLPQTKAALSLEDIQGVVYTEPVRKIKTMSIPAIFNDPKLGQQWHYYNDGTAGSSYKSGSDINVFPVWSKYTGGSSNVIVAVEDVGVDLTHEDLAAICLPGGPNGSKCFVNGYVGYTIYGENHASHVAGTIAAINNNGKGVCGIAGGLDGNGGVRIMSVQIMRSDPSDPDNTLQGDDSAAMVWAADHGAVISQNSWGYSYSSREQAQKGSVGAVKAAIDYFVKYAGCDKDGNQRPDSPMKGGVVFFSAGNDGWDIGWPAAYEGVIAVGAVSSMLTRSYYSNYGDWVDICAPGGDSKIGPTIMSCYANNNYGTMQGTSMACPHVSGVAALIVSYFGGQGFTNEMLKEKLLEGANTTKISTAYKIGPLVDALGSFTYGGTTPPEKVTEYTVSASSNNITFDWKVTADPDDLAADHYLLVISKTKSQVTDFNPKEKVPTGVTSISVEVGDKKVGDAISGTITGLEFGTTYYTGIVAVDYNGNTSEMSEVKSTVTGVNNPPVITPKTTYETPVLVKAHESRALDFTITDPDGHSFTCDFTGGSDAATWAKGTAAGYFTMTIVGKNAEAGDYVANIKAVDAFGATSTLDVPYKILVNHAPTVIGTIDNKIFTATGQSEKYDLSKVFTDEDGERLTYSAESSNTAVAHPYINNGTLTVTSLGFGTTVISVTATDYCGLSATTSFIVVVRDPATGPDVEMSSDGILTIGTYYAGTVNVVVTNASGAKVFGKDIESQVFSPIEIDLSSCASGIYGLSVSYDGKTFNSKFVKK